MQLPTLKSTLSSVFQEIKCQDSYSPFESNFDWGKHGSGAFFGLCFLIVESNL